MKTKMKSFAIIMAFVILVSSFTVFTASAANISYSVTSVEGKKGDTVTVSVKLSSDIDVWGSNVMLAYNSSELEVVSCTKGDVASSGSLHNTGSSVNYSGMYSAKKGTVYTVKFKILKSSGASNLTLTSTENIDSSGKNYTCSVTSGKVTVIGGSVATGDVNGDGNTTAVDARIILQYVAGSRSLTAAQLPLVDMNGDGNVTAVDARIILQKVAGLK
jgi:hypothetical protein